MSFPGGIQSVTELARRLTEGGGSIRIEREVDAAKRSTWVVTVTGQDNLLEHRQARAKMLDQAMRELVRGAKG